MTGIYKITSPSGRVYIGQAVDIEDRFKDYRSYSCKSQIKLYNSLKKYGVDEHIFEYKEECTQEQLNNREGYWQDFYKCVEKGLNCRRVRTDDRSGYLSEETKQRMRDVRPRGKDSPRYGVKISPEIIEKTKQTIIKNRENGIYHYACQAVENIITGEIYYCITEAATKIGIEGATLRKYLRGELTNRTELQFLDPSLRPNKKVHIPDKGQIVLDTATGVYYYNIKEAASILGMPLHILRDMINGRRENNTTLICAPK